MAAETKKGWDRVTSEEFLPFGVGGDVKKGRMPGDSLATDFRSSVRDIYSTKRAPKANAEWIAPSIRETNYQPAAAYSAMQGATLNSDAYRRLGDQFNQQGLDYARTAGAQMTGFGNQYAAQGAQQSSQMGGMLGQGNTYGAQAQSALAQQTAARGQMGGDYAALGRQLDATQRAAAGGAPSVAQAQQQAGLEAALRGQMAASQSGPGFNPAAQVAASNNAAQMQRQAVNDAAQLRAAEMAQARGEVSGLLNSRAALSQAQQGLDLQRSGALLGAQNASQGMGVQYGQLGNQTAGLGAQYAGLANQVQNTGLQTQGLGLQSAQVGLGYDQNALANRALMLQGSMAYDQAGQQAAYQQNDFNLRQELANQESEQAVRERQGKLLGGFSSAIGGAIGMISDERQKTNVSQLSSEELLRRIGGVEPVDYQYKTSAVARFPDLASEGQHTGVMAQDLERNGLGGMVRQMPDGTKTVDTNQAAMTALAGVSALAKQKEKPLSDREIQELNDDLDRRMAAHDRQKQQTDRSGVSFWQALGAQLGGRQPQQTQNQSPPTARFGDLYDVYQPDARQTLSMDRLPPQLAGYR